MNKDKPRRSMKLMRALFAAVALAGMSSTAYADTYILESPRGWVEIRAIPDATHNIPMIKCRVRYYISSVTHEFLTETFGRNSAVIRINDQGERFPQCRWY